MYQVIKGKHEEMWKYWTGLLRDEDPDFVRGIDLWVGDLDPDGPQISLLKSKGFLEETCDECNEYDKGACGR